MRPPNNSSTQYQSVLAEHQYQYTPWKKLWDQVGVVRELLPDFVLEVLGWLGADDDAIEPVLSDDRRVVELLHREGRVRQPRIAEEFGWSASKTSRVLSRMEDDGVIDREWVGPGKVAFLAHYHRPPPAYRSPEREHEDK